MPKQPRKKKATPRKRSHKTVAEIAAELGAELYDNHQPRGDAVFAPEAFDDENDLTAQTLPMQVIRRWFA